MSSAHCRALALLIPVAPVRTRVDATLPAVDGGNEPALDATLILGVERLEDSLIVTHLHSHTSARTHTHTPSAHLFLSLTALADDLSLPLPLPCFPSASPLFSPAKTSPTLAMLSPTADSPRIPLPAPGAAAAEQPGGSGRT